MKIDSNVIRGAARRGYSLIELLAAGAVMAVGVTAAVSLAGSLMLQEEFAWRVAVTRNYQENMARLWQLGLTPAEITRLMPDQRANPVLGQVLYGNPMVVENGTQSVTSGITLATVEAATCVAAVNVSQDIRREEPGATQSIRVYRPRLPTELRP
jgi:prepilin-type N-terminal cleavage/methylation domain-containing protein